MRVQRRRGEEDACGASAGISIYPRAGHDVRLTNELTEEGCDWTRAFGPYREGLHAARVPARLIVSRENSSAISAGRLRWRLAPRERCRPVPMVDGSL
jgi:hypothetical protein